MTNKRGLNITVVTSCGCKYRPPYIPFDKVKIDDFKNHPIAVKHTSHTKKLFDLGPNNELIDFFFRNNNKAAVVRSTGRYLGDVLPSM